MKKKTWFFIIATCFLLGSAYVFYQTYLHVPDFTLLRAAVEIDIIKRDGSEGIKRVGPKAPGWVPLSNIADGVTFAVVASEDTSYFSHQGIDVHELKEAIKKDLKERKFARGGSTITQQVIKNVFLSHEKTLWRKFREILWAREMDKVLTKSEVLAFYLNMVEWGPGIYGINEAAQHYFQSHPSNLSPKQGAFLAMLLPSPRKYYISFKKKELTNFAGKRVDQILRVMVKMKFISEPAYQIALDEPLFPLPEPLPAIAVDGEPHPHDQPLETPPLDELSPIPQEPSDVLQPSPPEESPDEVLAEPDES